MMHGERPSTREIQIVYAVFVTIVVLAKLPVLATPYHWDEVVWIGFTQRLADMPLWRALPGLQPAFKLGGRPTGLLLTVAALFQMFGTSIWLSHLLIVGFAAVGVCSTYRLGSYLHGPWVGILAAMLLFGDALFFAQSAMFVADLPVAALGVASVSLALRKRYRAYLLCALYLVLLKETALAIVAVIAAYVLLTEWRQRRWAAVREAVRYAVPLLVMAAYYGAQKLVNGKFFVNYANNFDPFQLTLSSARAQFRFVTSSLFLMQGRRVCAILIVAALLWRRRVRREWLLFLLIFIASGYSFCFIYFLPRYVLPCAPYFFIMTAWALTELVRGARPRLLAVAALFAFLLSKLLWPELMGSGEWNMGYLTMVRMQADACRYVATQFPGARVLTRWPYTVYLNRPEMGYVAQPVVVDAFIPERDAYDADVVLVGAPMDGEHNLDEYVRTRHLPRIAANQTGPVRWALYDARAIEGRRIMLPAFHARFSPTEK